MYNSLAFGLLKRAENGENNEYVAKIFSRGEVCRLFDNNKTREPQQSVHVEIGLREHVTARMWNVLHGFMWIQLIWIQDTLGSFN